MKDIRRGEFVIFDVETTGLSPFYGDRIVEIAALKIKNLKPVDRFYSFINPQREISFGAFLVNGITPDMLKGAPASQEVLSSFLRFLGNAVLVGHNVRFDLSFLCHELSLMGRCLNQETTVIDTIKMAKKLLPSLNRYPLWYVAESLGIKKRQKHRAMADVDLTFKVFRRLIRAMGKKDIHEIGVLPHILESFNRNPAQEEILR